MHTHDRYIDNKIKVNGKSTSNNNIVGKRNSQYEVLLSNVINKFYKYTT